MEDFFRQNLALLKASEAKLAAAMWFFPNASKSELMRISGLTDRVTYWRAYRGLLMKGMPRHVATTQQYAAPMQQIVAPLQQEVAPPQQTVAPEQRYVAQPQQEDVSLDFEDALIAADEMDDSGDFRSHTSPFSLRRKQQIELLQQAWGDLFGETISALAVKELLQLAFSESIDVYHVMVQASDRKVQYPKAYIKKTLQEIAKKPQNRPPARTAEEGLLPVTDEMRQSWAENEKLVAGYMSGWEV